MVYLLESLKTLKEKRTDFVLEVVGDGEYRKEYEKISKEWGLEGLVVFRGFLTKEETADFMRRSDFCVFPSLWETFSVVCIEAMACAKPLIVTDLPVFREKVDEKAGIIVPRENAGELGKAIDFMLDHCQDYPVLENSKKSLDEFGDRKVGEKIDSVYRKILKDLK
jgi:glycosyltransferase involved in cell wall biosynthesis